MSEHNSIPNGQGKPLVPVAVYFRMSTDKQEHSIERQRSQVVPYCERMGYTIVAEYKDEGLAGDLFEKRPGFQQLLKDAPRGKFKRIVVDEQSRLSRQDKNEFIALVIYPLQKARVQLDAANKGPVDYDSLAGGIMAMIDADKASGESKNLSRRVLSRILNKARAGIWVGGIVPYGMCAVRDERFLEPTSGKSRPIRKLVPGTPEEVKVVQWVFDRVANHGWTVGVVCAELTRRGVQPPKGNGRGANKALCQWERSAIRRMVKNRKYVGDLPWNQVHTGKYSRCVGGPKNGQILEHDQVNKKVLRNDEADWVIILNTHEGIIDRDTFARANLALLHNRKNTNPQGVKGDHLFTRLLVCGDCGAFMGGGRRRTMTDRPKTYCCSSYYRRTKEACWRNSVDESVVKDQVIEAIQREILNPDCLQTLRSTLKMRLEEMKADGLALDLQRRISDLEARIDQGTANLAVISRDRIPGVEAKLREWERERDGLQAELRSLDTSERDIEEIMTEAESQLWRLREGLEAEDIPTLRSVLREMIERIELRFTHTESAGRKRNKLVGGTIILREQVSHLGHTGR
jgi:DNA invertase Pin-like site-specific DNA recombinase